MKARKGEVYHSPINSGTYFLVHLRMPAPALARKSKTIPPPLSARTKALYVCRVVHEKVDKGYKLVRPRFLRRRVSAPPEWLMKCFDKG